LAMARKAGLVGRVGGHLGRGEIEQRAGGLQIGRHVGEHELGVLEIGDRLAELLALLGVGDRLVEAALRAAQRAGADVEPAAVEPHHRDAEAFAFGADRFSAGTRTSSKSPARSAANASRASSPARRS
jgi:hypothetical protein